MEQWGRPGYGDDGGTVEHGGDVTSRGDSNYPYSLNVGTLLKDPHLCDFMASLRRTIVKWRVHGGLLKSAVGFWSKLLIEAGIIIGVPVAGCIFVATELIGVSVSSLPHVPQSTHPRFLAWSVLSGSIWLQHLRCMLSDGLEIKKQPVGKSPSQQSQQ